MWASEGKSLFFFKQACVTTLISEITVTKNPHGILTAGLSQEEHKEVSSDWPGGSNMPSVGDGIPNELGILDERGK